MHSSPGPGSPSTPSIPDPRGARTTLTLFRRRARPGAFVAPGEAIGRIVNLVGETVEELASPCESEAYVAALRGEWFPTHGGDMVAELLPVEGHECPEEEI